ncbi:MAG TPA: LacI family DNA-binding transcriptional regulator [Bacteroidales bacterium]|nr:LacI family DNA-binding transcriptional regulator [Bacteroidales bacterium]
MGKKFKNKDLAARLGVSSTLVSLVLNNKADEQGIKKDTQEKVLAMAKLMGFFSSSTGETESLPVEDKPGILGMVVPSCSDPFVIQITPFLQKAFSSIGVGFSIITKDTDDQRYDRLVGAFRKFYSGLILYGDAADENTIRALRTADYPFIILEKNSKTLRLNTITTDTSAGASIVVNHISKLGYKNVVIVADRKLKHLNTSEIHDVTEAMSKLSSFNKPVIIEIDNTLIGDDIDFSKFEHLLRPPYRIDIMIIMNAGLVYPIMSLLRRKNLRVPQDIALISMEEGIGFDLMFSPVTALKKQLAGMSVKIANMIWSEVRNSGKGKYKRQVSIPPELIVRNSCGNI